MAGSALNAEINGKRIGKAGDAAITLNLKGEGSKLAGTINNSLSPGNMALESGKINGME